MNLDNTKLRKLIPGIIHEVEGESTLYDKLLPWLESVKTWLETNVLGSDFDPAIAGVATLAEKIIVNEAFACAIPSLDLVLSPAGFAVIDTDGRAPASKERIERLIASLQSSVDANMIVLVAMLCKCSEWRATDRGKWYCGTFIPTMDEVHRFRKEGDSLLGTYDRMRTEAQNFELEAEELYLGPVLTDQLRQEQFSTSEHDDLIGMIRDAELQYIGRHINAGHTRCPDDHEVWHLIRPIVDRLRYYPALYAVWQADMGEKFHVEPFKNKNRGGFFF